MASSPSPRDGSETPTLATLDADSPRTPPDSTSHGTACLQTLPSTSTLVLFTPFLRPGPVQAKSCPADPFEDFGRALSQYHRRIRHIPYIPRAADGGMTPVHKAFIEHADAVVLVVCFPWNVANHDSMFGESYDADSLEAWAEGLETFTEQVRNLFASRRAGRDKEVPETFVQVSLGLTDLFSESLRVGARFNCISSDPQALVPLARELFEDDVRCLSGWDSPAVLPEVGELGQHAAVELALR